MFHDDLTGPEGTTVEVETVMNGSLNGLSGNFTLYYGTKNTTWPIPFNATEDEMEAALEVRGSRHANVKITSGA